MSAGRIETVERPRREAPANVKTSHFLKKVSNVRSTRRKSTDGRQLGVPEAFHRTTRSIDLGQKDLAMLTSQHTAVHMDRTSHTPSPSGGSSENGPESHHADLSIMPSQAGSPRPASATNAARPEAVSTSLPACPQVPEGNGVTVESRNIPSGPLPVASSSSTPLASGQISPGLSDRRTLAPRLATLPPPMMASYMAKGSARLTPSIVSRQPPMPVLNLPPLPPVTPSQHPERPRQQAPLRSIPALPMRGPSEAQQDEADHDNAMLEEDEEDDMDAEDDNDTSPGAGAGADADGVASDEEMEDGTETESSAAPRSRGDRIGGLPQIEASRLHAEITESLRGTVYFTPKPDGPSTPRLRPGSSSSAATDYFTALRSDRQADRPDSPVRTPRPTDFFGSPALHTPALGHAACIAGMPPGSPGRPGLYHLGSRSMVDLLSMGTKGKETATSPSITADVLAERLKSKPLPGSPPMEKDDQSTPKPSSEPQDILPSTPTLRRQRSMPIYKVSSDPPPYPDFHPRRPEFVILPRDEEGVERLPMYSNAIYLAAVMPRKVEFSAPGVQAKDRKWRRVLCVLEGTAFRVYKCPPSIAGVSAIESWWEKKVGVGDITVVNTGAVTQSGIRVSAVRGRAENERTGKEDMEPASPDPNTRLSDPPPPPAHPAPSRSKLRLPGSLLHPSRSNNSKDNSTPSRLSVSSSQTSTSSQTQPRQSMEPSQDDHSSISVVPRASIDVSSSRRASYVSSATSPRSPTSNRSSATSPTASDSSSTFFRSRILHASPPADAGAKSVSDPDPKDLIKAYSLQHAESGLASDYGKRKNVIRVRMEGEQFLLQAPDVAAVIDWIEGIQAATNIALDLDERPMPKGPMFPRRRRRRPRTQTAAAGNTAGGAIANPAAAA